MTKSLLKTAVITMNSQAVQEDNFEQAFRLVADAAQAGASWVVLPEVFNFIGPKQGLLAAAHEEGGALFQRLADAAHSYGIYLFAGSVGERVPGSPKVYNTMWVFEPSGALIARYRKIHLFNLRAPDGQAILCEEDDFLAGDTPVVLDIDGLRVGLGICYDLRFSELFNLMSRSQPLDVLVLPAAFTEMTGRDHWQLLLQARAVEYQCFVLAANQGGAHNPQRSSYGHSMIIDPWGKISARTGVEPGFAIAELPLVALQEVRQRLPAVWDRQVLR